MSGDLAGLDRLEASALLVPLFEAPSEPIGVAAYVDWRLGGRLARLRSSGGFRGARGESLLMPARGRVGADRVFLYGLGAAAAFAREPHDRDVAPMLEIARAAGARSVALAPPVGPGNAPSARAVVDAWRAALSAHAELWILDGDGTLSA